MTTSRGPNKLQHRYIADSLGRKLGVDDQPNDAARDKENVFFVSTVGHFSAHLSSFTMT